MLKRYLIAPILFACALIFSCFSAASDNPVFDHHLAPVFGDVVHIAAFADTAKRGDHLNPQQAEIDKYSKVYKDKRYRMGDARMTYAKELVREAVPECNTHLDVGCGRGEMVGYANGLGFESRGVEAVDYLTDGFSILHGKAWDLPVPDNSIDLVTMFDVIEHLLPEDTERTLAELRRVAKKEILITAANYSSKSMGVELHVNRKPYPEWDQLLRTAFADCDVDWLPRKHNIQSETWRISLPA